MLTLKRMTFLCARAAFALCRYLSRHISDEEMIVRAIFSPYHVDSKTRKLKRAAFDPFPETDEISVMRVSILGPHRCKARARKLEDPANRKVYTGFAVLSARKIRNASMAVVDSRNDNFLGHADIKTGVIMPKRGVPKEPEQMWALRAVADELVSKSRYCPDPCPKLRKWAGEALVPKPSRANRLPT